MKHGIILVNEFNFKCHRKWFVDFFFPFTKSFITHTYCILTWCLQTLTVNTLSHSIGCFKRLHHWYSQNNLPVVASESWKPPPQNTNSWLQLQMLCKSIKLWSKLYQLCLCEEQRAERIPIYYFAPQMPATVGSNLRDRNSIQGFYVSNRSPITYHLIPPRLHMNRKL